MEGQHLLECILDGAKDPTDLPLALLQEITDNFSEEKKIGQGGFGAVYKGALGERIVAVKRIYINVNTFDDRLFRSEILSLWNTNHRNVVRFLGFCSSTYHKTIQDAGSGDVRFASVLERLLCFEYISNGSLDTHITDELRGHEWETRYEIIIGICKGLHYLHNVKKIIHMDLKPENIILHNQDDKYMVPKITDFGLSRTIEKSHTVTRFGTRGYMAPEYINYGETTFMSDIYSLGAIIIELVTGCKDIPNKHNVLRRWRHRWNGPPTQLQYQQVTRCIDIAGQCRAEKPEARPSISNIISFLSESESTHGQISPLLDEDDMLGIKPLELRLPSDLDKKIARSIELTNGTHKCIAFNIQLPDPERYSAQPVKGIMRPGFKYDVKITVQARDIHRPYRDMFSVQSMKASEDLTEDEITKHMSGAEAHKVVDKVDLMVVYESTKPQENCNRRGDTNMPAEAKKRKIVESALGKGKNKIGNNENAEATSMGISSSERGQPLDHRRNFHPPENFSHSQPTNRTYLLRDGDRAMDVTRGAMGSLLHKLGELLKEEFNLETSVKKDIHSLSEELVEMQPVLRKVSEVQQDNLDDMVKRWASNVREMSYDLEDFVDGFLVQIVLDSDGSGFRQLTHEMCFLLDKEKSQQSISDLIKEKRRQVHGAAEKCKEYKVDNIVRNASTKAAIDDLRNLAIHQDKEELIGIETPIDELIKLLEKGGDVSSQNFKIVSIVGLGGLGKTTLANAVYKELQGQFEARAFVPVGRNPDMKIVLKKIISEIEKDVNDCKKKKNDVNSHKMKKKGVNAENLDMDRLIKTLNELLKNKRYFVVIDDLWGPEESLHSQEKEAWDFIKCAFPKNNHGSRVITTTRNHDVALASCSLEPKYIYRIKPLSKEESKKLFFRKAFGPERDCPDTLKHISDDILKRCGGMPLAINSIGSRLAGKPYSTWDYVRKSLGGLTEGNDLVNMKRILDLSYIHLPDHLKTCLLHVGMYPEDYEIDKDVLLRKWVAEGTVCAKGRLNAEDVAENNFKALISMCMIEPGKIDYNDEVLSCRVHDIILDLIRSKSSEENFMHVIDGLKDVSGEVRRVSVQRNHKGDSEIFKTIKGSVSHARSVLLYRRLLLPYFWKCKYVRVLHLEDAFLNKLLDLTGISSLFFLRYLKIDCYTHEWKLPDQIGQLQQLETIDLRGGELKYPSDIVTLPRLSHLRYSGYWGTVLPSGIERLKSLRTLEGVCVGKSSVETINGLGELTNLRNLGISSCFTRESKELASARMDALHSSISRLSTSLMILTLEGGLPEGHDLSSWSRPLFPPGSHIQKLHLSDCSFERCPEWIGQLHNLYSLSIKVREVADGLTIVGGLHSLAYFHLFVDKNKEKEESVVISGSGAFQTLKHLIVDSENTSLTYELGALPKLEKLDIPLHYNINRRLTYPPVGIGHLPAPTLKKISLAVSAILGDWKVKGSERWNNCAWERYFSSDHYKHKIEEHARKNATLLKRAFKSHHPSADIYIEFEDYNYLDNEDVDEEKYVVDGDEEQGEDAYADEDYCNEVDGEENYVIDGGEEQGGDAYGGEDYCNEEDCYSSEEDDRFGVYEEAGEENYVVDGDEEEGEDAYADEDEYYCNEEDNEDCYSSDEDDGFGDYEEADEGAYLGNGSETSAQALANTRQLVELMDVHEDSGRVSINTDASLMAHTSVDLAVGSEGQQTGRGSQDMAVLEYSQLPFTSLLVPLPSSLYQTLELFSSPDTAGTGRDDLSQAPNEFDDEDWIDEYFN